jgi:hypothetical protein
MRNEDKFFLKKKGEPHACSKATSRRKEGKSRSTWRVAWNSGLQRSASARALGRAREWLAGCWLLVGGLKATAMRGSPQRLVLRKRKHANQAFFLGLCKLAACSQVWLWLPATTPTGDSNANANVTFRTSLRTQFFKGFLFFSSEISLFFFLIK